MGKTANPFDILHEIKERLKEKRTCTLNLEALKQRVPNPDHRNMIIHCLKKQEYELEYLIEDHQLKITKREENVNETKEAVPEGVQQYFQRNAVDRDLYRLL